MGLLDKWTKKQEKEQLEATEKKTEAPVESTKKVAKKVTKRVSKKNSIAYRIIVQPIVSEKATTQEMQGKYVFAVKASATKEDVKNAVEQLYGVRPKKVRTMMFEGKRVRFGQTRGKRSDWKKAIVVLPKGHTIHIHEGV